jgi:hypothetical protein
MARVKTAGPMTPTTTNSFFTRITPSSLFRLDDPSLHPPVKAL